MKRLITFLSLSLLLCINSINANNIVIDCVEYIRIGSNTASCRVAKKIPKSVTKLSIKPSVPINGFTCKVIVIEDEGFSGRKNLYEISIPESIERIGKNAFEGCTHLKKLVVPNSVKYFGERAFWDCKSLESIVMPDNATVDLAQYGYVAEFGIFKGCKNLNEIHGTKVEYPKYLKDFALKNCEDVPFYFLMSNLEFSDDQRVEFQPFSTYAKAKIKQPIEEWQKKKEYETTAQWRKRVTEQSREEKKQQLLDMARQEYINLFAPKKLNAKIGTYDADYNVFPIIANGMGTFYARVPIDEAEAFKAGFSTVKMTPVYGIIDDKVGVLSCTFETVGNHLYATADTYHNDATNDAALGLSPLEINVMDDVVTKADVKTSASPSIRIDNSIDLNIPIVESSNERTFVFTIGNENYSNADAVPFAINDATVFSKYCNQTLGVPIKNLNRYKDATYGTMLEVEERIAEIVEAYASDRNNITLILYYSGHGFPEEGSENAYLLPVDGSPKRPEACYSLQRLYDRIGELGVGRAVVFLDACFSGTKRGNGMISQARGTAIKPKACQPSGNTVVFAASSGMQTAYPFDEKGHGLFTYYLLSKLRESKGEVTLGDLGKYLSTEVNRQAVLTIKKKQTPEVVPSANFTDWEKLKLK